MHSRIVNLVFGVFKIYFIELSIHHSCRYSCFNFQACSLWMSFGVYVTGVLFQTAAFVSFLLISHGYCIMCERLSLNERRTTAVLGCFFYLTLVGYKACVPYFAVSFLLVYLICILISKTATLVTFMVLWC